MASSHRPSDRTARIYSPFLPYPFTEGSFPVIYDQAKTLAELGWSVEMVVWKDSLAEVVRKLRAATTPFTEEISIRVLTDGARSEVATAAGWLDVVDPRREREIEPIAKRTLRVMRSLASPWASPEVFHYPRELDPGDDLPAAELGIYHYSFAVSWLAESRRPERRTVVHFHNFESDLARLRVRAPGTGIGGGLIHRMNARKLARHERRLGRLADELWFLSSEDLRAFDLEGNAVVRHVPPTFDVSQRERRVSRYLAGAAREDEIVIGFIGGCYFEPNRASVEWIVDRLAPELESAGFGGKVLIAGRGVPEALRRRSARFGFFEWAGFVADLEEFWRRISFFLVPHVCGSGVRIKLIESLVSGVPVLATTAAVLPLHPAVRRSGLLSVSDDPRDWARRVASEPAPFHTRGTAETDDPALRALAGSEVYHFLHPERGQDPLQEQIRS